MEIEIILVAFPTLKLQTLKISNGIFKSAYIFFADTTVAAHLILKFVVLFSAISS